MRSKQLLRNLKKALKQDHLYNEEELIFMKKQLKMLEEDFSKTRNKPEGFGK
tara:strand:+ start:333 stop:488 length:156 start_codon:yes stop_codon:yes gene_type:complete